MNVILFLKFRNAPAESYDSQNSANGAFGQKLFVSQLNLHAILT
jgi:hypothetical protein